MKRTILIICAVLSGCFSQLDRPFDKQIKARDLIDQGVMQLEQGQDEQAMATFEMAFEVFPLPEALDGIGCVHLYRGNLVDSEKYFNLALEQDPEYAVAFGHLAMLAELRGQNQLADELFQTALLYEPEDVRLRNNYSAFLFDRHQEGAANLVDVRQELLRANSLTNSKLIRDNYNIVEDSYEKKN